MSIRVAGLTCKQNWMAKGMNYVHKQISVRCRRYAKAEWKNKNLPSWESIKWQKQTNKFINSRWTKCISFRLETSSIFYVLSVIRCSSILHVFAHGGNIFISLCQSYDWRKNFPFIIIHRTFQAIYRHSFLCCVHFPSFVQHFTIDIFVLFCWLWLLLLSSTNVKQKKTKQIYTTTIRWLEWFATIEMELRNVIKMYSYLLWFPFLPTLKTFWRRLVKSILCRVVIWLTQP